MMAGPLPKEIQDTINGFGWEWSTFNDQIQNTYMTDRANFLDFICPVTESFFEGRLVLDAGCGMGRFLRLGAEFGSREIIGVDLSHAVDVAYQNTRALPHAHVVQADILALPFVRKFDYIFSVGVLQFMPHPRQGFSRLVDLLQDEGRISVWVYSKENNGWVINLLSPLRKHITSRLPRSILYRFSQLLGLVLFAVIKLVYQPANEVPFKLGRMLPYNDYLFYSAKLTFSSLVSVIFDHLAPQLVTYISREELSSWFREENLADIEITSRNNMSWRGQGTRSVRASYELHA